jgi:rhodanese-related sulfurtransferase
MKKIMTKLIPLLILISFLVAGCARDESSTTITTEPASSPQNEQLTGPMFQGKIVEKSDHAKNISIFVGKGKNAKTVMVSFDKETKGIEHATKGHSSIIYYEMRDNQPWATVIRPILPGPLKGYTEITTDELKTLIDTKTDFVLIDACPKNRYSAGHIIGAINLGTRAYKKNASTTLPEDKNELLVIYCGGIRCGRSTKVAKSAVNDGYKNVKVYLQGQPAWIKAGNAVYASNDHITKENIVLIDLRSKNKSTSGRIAHSVTFPYSSLDEHLEDIPANAPVVLYSDNTKDVNKAMEDLRGKGHKKVALIAGNYDGWVKSGGPTVKGPIETAISWKRQLGINEVSKADFMRAVNGTDTETVILDVRSTDETNSGGFKNAISIPLGQIVSRLSEIPKNKKVYVHCTTGARADMAVQKLRENGYNAFFLVATINCEGNNCTIQN